MSSWSPPDALEPSQLNIWIELVSHDNCAHQSNLNKYSLILSRGKTHGLNIPSNIQGGRPITVEWFVETSKRGELVGSKVVILERDALVNIRIFINLTTPPTEKSIKIKPLSVLQNYVITRNKSVYNI